MATAAARRAADQEEGEAQVSDLRQATEEERRQAIARLTRKGMYRHADGYIYRRSGVICDPRADELVAFGWDAAIQIVLAGSQAA